MQNRKSVKMTMHNLQKRQEGSVYFMPGLCGVSWCQRPREAPTPGHSSERQQ